MRSTSDPRFPPMREHGRKEFSFQCLRYTNPLTVTSEFADSASNQSKTVSESTTTIPFTSLKAESKPSKSIRNVTLSSIARTVTSELGGVKAGSRLPLWASGSSTSSTREALLILSGGFLSATDGGRPQTQMARASRDVTALGKPDYEPAIQRSESNATRIQQRLD